jgi:hypothetical protein
VGGQQRGPSEGCDLTHHGLMATLGRNQDNQLWPGRMPGAFSDNVLWIWPLQPLCQVARVANASLKMCSQPGFTFPSTLPLEYPTWVSPSPTL